MDTKSSEKALRPEEMLVVYCDDEYPHEAYSVAASVAMYFFFGLRGEFEGILALNNGWSKDNEGEHDRTALIKRNKHRSPEVTMLRVQQLIMSDLAGDGVDDIVEDQQDDWFNNLRRFFYSSIRSADLLAKLNNYRREELYGPCKRPQRVLRIPLQLACWTVDVITHPRMWPVISALATELIEREYIGSEDEAWRIMAAAYGSSGVPVQELGAKWRRRFPMK